MVGNMRRNSKRVEPRKRVNKYPASIKVRVSQEVKGKYALLASLRKLNEADVARDALEEYLTLNPTQPQEAAA